MAHQTRNYFGIPVNNVDVKAGEAMSLATVNGAFVLTPYTTTNNKFAGIALESFTALGADTQKNQEPIISVAYDGICEALATGAITAGADLQASAGGVATKTGENAVVAVALSSGAVGEFVRIRLLG